MDDLIGPEWHLISQWISFSNQFYREINDYSNSKSYFLLPFVYQGSLSTFVHIIVSTKSCYMSHSMKHHYWRNSQIDHYGFEHFEGSSEKSFSLYVLLSTRTEQGKSDKTSINVAGIILFEEFKGIFEPESSFLWFSLSITSSNYSYVSLFRGGIEQEFTNIQ